MGQEESPNQPIPISHARTKRESSPKLEIASEELRQILAEVVDQQVSAKITRLETSINRMMDHIEAVRSGDTEDSALRVTADEGATDLALAKISLPSEDYYPYTCDVLAEKLSVRRHDVLQMIKLLSLRDNKKYHGLLQTGKSSKISRWSEAAFSRMRGALDLGEYCKPAN